MSCCLEILNCIICHEDIIDSDEIVCRGHAVHTKCLFEWCQKQTISTSHTKCLACINYLPDDQQAKLVRYLEGIQEKIVEIAKRDQIGALKICLHQRRLWSERCFLRLIETALSSRSFRVLSYLRHIEGLYLSLGTREALVNWLFDQRTEMGIRWLLNRFDDQGFKVPPIENSLKLLEVMRKHGRFRELFWVYQTNYKSLPQNVQFEYILHIFRAFKETKFEYDKEFRLFFHSRTAYYYLLPKLAWKYKDDACYILGTILPYAAMKEFDPKSLTLRNILHHVNTCPSCKGSHIPDAVLMAIKESEPEFLRYVLARNSGKNNEPRIPTVELIRLIAKSNRSEEILDIIETLNRWKGARKLRKLYNETVKKSQVQVSFWKLFVA